MFYRGKRSGEIFKICDFNRLYQNPSYSYFCRLQTDPINPLLKESFSICKSVDSDRIYAWYSFKGNIFKELDLEIKDFENFTRPFASIKHSQF
jgi:hypothetical protein